MVVNGCGGIAGQTIGRQEEFWRNSHRLGERFENRARLTKLCVNGIAWLALVVHFLGKGTCLAGEIVGNVYVKLFVALNGHALGRGREALV